MNHDSPTESEFIMSINVSDDGLLGSDDSPNLHQETGHVNQSHELTVLHRHVLPGSERAILRKRRYPSNLPQAPDKHPGGDAFAERALQRQGEYSPIIYFPLLGEISVEEERLSTLYFANPDTSSILRIPHQGNTGESGLRVLQSSSLTLPQLNDLGDHGELGTPSGSANSQVALAFAGETKTRLSALSDLWLPPRPFDDQQLSINNTPLIYQRGICTIGSPQSPAPAQTNYFDSPRLCRSPDQIDPEDL